LLGFELDSGNGNGKFDVAKFDGIESFLSYIELFLDANDRSDLPDLIELFVNDF